MKSCILGFILFAATSGFGQKYVAKESKVSFFSDAPVEDISAVNEKTDGIFDLSSKKFAFSVPINAFQFDKSLMKEHFNEKYMESDKFPKATFVGAFTNFNEGLDSQTVTASGKLTIHGVERVVDINGQVKKTKDGYEVNASFPVKLEDHNIRIPQLLFRNIAEKVEVSVYFLFSLK